MEVMDRARRVLQNPQLLFRLCNRLYHQRGREYNHQGFSIFDDDWDNLIILDACRYDVFEKINPIDGDLIQKESRGSTTSEFLRGNIDGEELTDTVYVTANPQYEKQYEGKNFHEVHNLFKSKSWDKASRTVPPDVFAREAIEIYEDNTDKRLIFHFIQPHAPFIGPFGRRVFGEDKLGWGVGRLSSHDNRDLYTAYVENLLVTLPSVEKLLKKVSGKSVVTSDHGEMIGERAFPFPIKEYSHPRGIYTKELVTVPWLVVNGEGRRDITGEGIVTEETLDEDLVNDRLAALGYK